MREWLVAMRKQAGKTQCEVASEAGIVQAFYSYIETGKRDPSPQTAKCIARVLGFDWTKFFKEECDG